MSVIKVNSIQHSGAANASIELNANGRVAFSNTVAFTSNVGIGTTSPGAKLDVAGTTRIVQSAAGTNGLLVNMPTGAETTASGIRVFGYSPAIELMDKDQVQNWHMAIDDNDGNKLVFARGYGPGQGIAPALAIDSSDRVTMPFMPAFWALGSGTQSWSGAATAIKVNFSAGGQYVTSNKSGGWSQANSRYTAPVAGTYEFMLSFAVQTGPSTGPAAFLYKNGSAWLEVVINYASTSYVQTTGTIMLDLNANDYVEFWITNYNNTSFTIDLGRCKFSGKLIG